MILVQVIGQIVSPQNSYIKSPLSVPQIITLFENTAIVDIIT